MRLTSTLPAVLAAVCFAVTGCQTTGPDRFNRADANRDALLSRDEINYFLVTDIFESRDANRDNRVSKQEWLVEGDAGQEKLFRARDANRDGNITLDEALAYGREKGMAADLVRQADKDKDGILSRPEITAYSASREGPVR